jgi:hypothetical protein
MCDTKLSLLLCRVAGQRRHLPFCRQYPTGTCAAGNGGVRSSRDNVASSVRMAEPDASPAPRPPAARGREPGLCGTVNPGEALLNAVMSNKRKLLRRLGQKTRGQVRVLFSLPAQMLYHRRKGAAYPTRRQRRNVVSPSPPRGNDLPGKPAAR